MSILSVDLTIKQMKKKPLDDLYGLLEMLWWESKSPECIIDDIGMFVRHNDKLKLGSVPESIQFAELCDMLILPAT